jgi:hypothetical protein
LIDSPDTHNILTNGHTCSFISALGGEGSYSICAEGEEYVVVDEYLSVFALGRVQGGISPCHKYSTSSRSFVIIGKEF